MFLYNLKKHKQKLKHHALGLFVINKSQYSGSLRLKNLDDVELLNFINYIFLKKYEDPIVLDVPVVLVC